MGMFRKKPIVIEAVQYQWMPLEEAQAKMPSEMVLNSHNYDEIQRFTYGATSPMVDGGVFMIETLEGYMIVTPGDWIIKGVAGEFSLIKPDIFEATYEAVEE